MHWIASPIPLLRVCPPITELSWQRYDWAYEGIQPKQQPLYTMTGPYWVTGIALQGKSKTHTPNDGYENFINANLEAAAEWIPTKQRAKPRVPWETLAVRKKQRRENCFQMQ